MTPVLAIHQATRSYGDGRTLVHALRGVSLEVTAGELVAVMGSSGSGKSTLLALAGGLDDPTAGTVLVHGRDVGQMSQRERAKLRRRTIGYVFQELNLVPSLTAVENAALPLELDGWSTKRAMAEARRALAEIGLDHLEDRFPDDLSGGEAQRVAITRAVVGERSLLLADEPTGALDSVTGEAVMGLLRERCDAGAAGVLVTHEARHAAWADRVVFLRDGATVDSAGPLPGPETLTEAEARR